jgi:hypothetical protein
MYHRIEWSNICPWLTCGAFVIETYKGINNNEFVPLNRFQFGIALDPAISDTLTYTTSDGKTITTPRYLQNTTYLINSSISNF